LTSRPDGNIGFLFGRWLRKHYSVVTVILCAAVSALGVGVAGSAGVSDGLIFDSGVMVRDLIRRSPAPATAVAVVEVDWPSLHTPETENLPRVLFAPVWKTLVDALATARAKALVFDFLFEFDANRLIANYDTPLLGSLHRSAGLVVLARTAETLPSRRFMAAVGAQGDPDSLAFAELAPDLDGVIRTVHPALADKRGTGYVTLSGAALHRLGVDFPGDAVRYLPTGPLEAIIPAWSLKDVLSCSASPAGLELLKKTFSGKAVFIGTALPEEDRKVASDRFLLRYGPAWPAFSTERTDDGCTLARLPPSSPVLGAVPGVFLHAAATEAAADGSLLKTVPKAAMMVLAAALAALAALAGTSLGPWRTLAAVTAMIAGTIGLSWGAPPFGLWLPVENVILAIFGSVSTAHVGRFMLEERHRRHLQRAFGHHIAPQLVEQLLEDGREPSLGGETREITCMFADLSGFTALSGKVDPQELMRITNHFLGLIVDQVNESGGYVDKFIGDAVMALWNAPAETPDHAGLALKGAFAAVEAVQAALEEARRKGEAGFSVKIGLNSGPATVGNVGTLNRHSYSAIGEAVNIASRCEGLAGVFGCPIILAEETARRVAGNWILCELDRVLVKGRDVPLAVYWPLAPIGAMDQRYAMFLEQWEKALTAYRAGGLTEAAGLWRDMEPPPAWPTGPFRPALVLADHAEKLAALPLEQRPAVWAVPKG
jgi:adenylate cyclase